MPKFTKISKRTRPWDDSKKENKIFGIAKFDWNDRVLVFSKILQNTQK